MVGRCCLNGLLLLCAGALVTSCNSGSLDSIVISPTTVTVTLSNSGEQLATHYTALGYYGHAGHQVVKDITDQVTWSTYFPQMVTISSSGVATPTGSAIGYTQIVATAPGFHGVVMSNSSTYTVNLTSSTSDVTTLIVTPANSTMTTIGATMTFTATGTNSSGTTETLTSTPTWTSSNTSVATINSSTGVATSVAAGTTYITAVYTNSDGTEVTGDTLLTVE